jgi:hypothetical protein
VYTSCTRADQKVLTLSNFEVKTMAADRDDDDDEPRSLLPVANRSAVLSAPDEPPADGLEYLLRVR